MPAESYTLFDLFSHPSHLTPHTTAAHLRIGSHDVLSHRLVIAASWKTPRAGMPSEEGFHAVRLLAGTHHAYGAPLLLVVEATRVSREGGEGRSAATLQVSPVISADHG